MAVGILPQQLPVYPVPGVRLGVSRAGMRYPNREDVVVVALEQQAVSAVVLTQNALRAAPVIVTAEHCQHAQPRALVINTGCANAGTGQQGIEYAKRTCAQLAQRLACTTEQVWPFSTGVIMEQLPIEKLIAGLDPALADLSENNWPAAARGIMTTDTRSKLSSKQVTIGKNNIAITGISKGSGMIKPNMATMLAFIAMDVSLSAAKVQALLQQVVATTFNAITVDGDTSTNDALVLIANGRGPVLTDEEINTQLYPALWQVAHELALAIVRDGEGASKLISIKVEGGRDAEECRQVGYSIAHSPLVKTAFFASDANLGRILSAIGNSGLKQLDMAKVSLTLNELPVFSCGQPDPDYLPQQGQDIMAQDEIKVGVQLQRGQSEFTCYTCDLSHGYIDINANYRS